MSLTRRTWTDDSGNLTSGTVLNNAELQRLYDDLDARWSIAPITLTGTQNNLSIADANGKDADFVVFNNATDLLVTGIAAPASPAKPGKPFRFICIGAGNVFFAHQNSGSSAANRLVNYVTVGSTPCAGGSGSGVFAYDTHDVTSSNWRWHITAHEQGGFITVPYSSGNFTGSGSMTWGVDLGDVLVSRYRVSGRQLTWIFGVTTTTVGGSRTAQLRATLPNGFTAFGRQGQQGTRVSDNGGTFSAAGMSWVSGANTFAEFYNDATLGTSWAAATNNTSIEAMLTIEVQ